MSINISIIEHRKNLNMDYGKTYRCQFCGVESPIPQWGEDGEDGETCPKCGKQYSWMMEQDVEE